MTEDDYVAMGSRKESLMGRFIVSAARLLIGLPLEASDPNYDKQQSLLAELQKAEDAHGFNVEAYPLRTRVMLLQALGTLREIVNDAMVATVADIAKGQGNARR